MKQNDGSILIIDDDTDVLFSAKLLLKDYFQTVHTTNEPAKISLLLNTKHIDLILLDMNYSGSDTSGKEGIYWLRKIMEVTNPPAVVMMTAFGTVELAVEAVKLGATDFVIKPWQNEKLLATLQSAYELKKSRQEVLQLQTTQKRLSEDMDKKFGELVGQSAAMKEVYNIIEKVAATDANILILGENGTGKELVARSIHKQSLRGHKTLINVDLGSINENLFESELFGHVKGSFTDAREDRPGRFEIASGSTLFLDEIGNIPLNLQSKLLTALQNRRVTRMGSNKPIPVDIRLISATNMPVYDKVEEGLFREDLLYRIKTIEIQIPPLRERDGDIALLAAHFLEMYCKKYRRQTMKISAETLKKLEEYPWPGNVRELQHAMERAVIMNEGRILKPHDFLLKDNNRRNVSKDVLKLDELETITIRKALEKHQFNISKAAKELGLSRAALYRKIEKYDLR
jgi:two-component system, NtrC family, response regulator HydG